ncbi:PnuC-like nicotinamide mononucleotide transport [Enterococcus phage EFDG1]|uniref:NrdR-regulated deoxyribonucleotide transporter n=1 Tax=Enterococcus phage EFDG1 TaxID=1597976 RepID=A0A347UYD8_9CAUD|nr:PnuC-like nicotinamide mononucleotide transport [Enterococcus phage EFDG1]AXY05381.1 NrdR-regulated deoxyribonucleotide transporter [Enterococcus phage EFDG1]
MEAKKNSKMEHIKKLFTYEYYRDGLTGWSKPARILWIVGMVIQVFTGLILPLLQGQGITVIGLTATIAGIIGFTCTVTITMGKSINGLLGFISAILLIGVASVTGNYSDIIMQSAYIILLDIPIIFSKRWNEGLKPRKMNRAHMLKTLVLIVVFWVALYLLDTVILHSPQAFLDATSAMIGLVGAVLCVKGFRAQYYFWTFQGLMSVALWIQTALHGHAVYVLMLTYMLYLANDVVAFTGSKWFKQEEVTHG